jgi:mono/diheme cytochrome c family protein
MPSRKRVCQLVICCLMLTIAVALVRESSADNRQRENAALARETLARRCFACHGANGAARKNVFVLDRDRLVASQIVIPGDSNSLLLKMVESGAMPMGGPELSKEERGTLRNWILGGAPSWDDEVITVKRIFLTEPAILALIRNDLLRARERDRVFLRYFSLAHLFNTGVQEAELETYRAALSKLVNSLSWNREINSLPSIDPARTVFRVDLRDYHWTAATWNSIIASYPYGVRGPESRNIDQLSGAALPYIRADWFAANASVPPLYHEILGLPRTALELERQLGVDATRDLEEEKNVARAGLRTSGVSQNNRVLERHVSPHGAYWKSFDFRNNLDDQNIFKDPLRLNPAGGEIIFNLPNGLQAYLLINAAGRRIDEAPIAIVADRNNPDDPVVRSGRSCMSCHYAGIQTFKDDVRPIVRGLAFATFDREKALAIYPTQDTLDRLMEEDIARFQSAVGQTGGRSISSTTEPINALSRRFFADLSVAQAAAEAGLDPNEFVARIARSERLLALGYGQLLVENGGIRRDAWDRNFGDVTQELQLGDYVASGVVLARRPVAGITNSPAGINRTSARTFGTRPGTADIMRTARTIVVRSMTIYLEPQQLESELRQRPEFKSLGLAIVRDEQMADIRIEINRAEFSFNYAYTVTNPQTSMVVASGSVTAWNGDVAAPRIAQEILKEIQAARQGSTDIKSQTKD